MHLWSAYEAVERLVVSGEEGLRALELAMRINDAIAERLMLR